MALPNRRIVYCGSVLAGKMYSLRSALGRAGQELPDPLFELRRRSHHFVLARAGVPLVEIDVQISDRRETVPSYDATSADCEERIRDEIDELVRADGLVVVIDSQAERTEATLQSFAMLRRDLMLRGVDPAAKPTVFQANKRDLANIVPMEWVRANFRSERSAYLESVATNNVGTLEALRELLRLTNAID